MSKYAEFVGLYINMYDIYLGDKIFYKDIVAFFFTDGSPMHSHNRLIILARCMSSTSLPCVGPECQVSHESTRSTCVGCFMLERNKGKDGNSIGNFLAY